MNLSPQLLDILINVCIGFEVFAAIIGSLFFYKYKKDKIINLFLPFLWYVAINELIGLFTKINGAYYNAIIYNIYNLITFSFCLFLFQYYLTKKNYKHIVKTFIITYLALFCINGFFQNYFKEHQLVPYLVGSLSLIITIVLYFVEVLNSEKVLNAKKSLLFWISVGLLLYYVGNTPFRILRNFYKYLTDASILFLVNFTLIIIKNTCFIIGFIWSDKKQQY